MAEKPISPLRKLEVAANRLNALTDRAGRQVYTLETLLNELSVGITISIPISGGKLGKTLDYRRSDDRTYQIVVVKHNPPHIADDIRPWDQCSREDKILAFKALPELITKLTDELESRAADAEVALESLSQMLPSSNQGGADDGRK